MRHARVRVPVALGALIGVSFGAPGLAGALVTGFDCVVHPNGSQTVCYACSNCTTGSGGPECGTIEKAANCSGAMRAKCTVTTDANGNPIYTATCDQKLIGGDPPPWL